MPPNLLSHLTVQVDRPKEGPTLGAADNKWEHDLQIIMFNSVRLETGDLDHTLIIRVFTTATFCHELANKLMFSPCSKNHSITRQCL